MNLDKKGAKLLFQAFMAPEESRATTGHQPPFAERDKTFASDARLCGAIADRITFHCTLISGWHRVLPLPSHRG